ncbi:TetR/AcrR family transcriptional regulator [Streptosporangium sp. NBC_01639]|uniref:TetR/AcrR family transcriptional regulator n=1 Tax=Streptosporangium sp. NBC_01639 TaxID=2975948 RepID=UPI0038652EB4|nr:TetR/AcrR family transcriptional regulator [Streptosporangium sp. NBC_01639]
MKSPRAEVVAEAAVTLLAERGMRGLTHRAVDEAAGLPPGSASNLARTRLALLELALERLTELEIAVFDPLAGAGGRVATEAGLGEQVVPGAGLAEQVVPGAGLAEQVALGALAEMTARMLWVQLTVDRRRTVARYELALEATRRPELRKIYDEAGARFRALAVELLAAAGSADPVRHGRQLVAFGEGVMFDAIAGAGTEPTPDDLRRGVEELLRGMLGTP